MKIKNYSEVVVIRNEEGYEFAKEFCEKVKNLGRKWKMEETNTSIIVAEWDEVEE